MTQRWSIYKGHDIIPGHSWYHSFMTCSNFNASKQWIFLCLLTYRVYQTFMSSVTMHGQNVEFGYLIPRKLWFWKKICAIFEKTIWHVLQFEGTSNYNLTINELVYSVWSSPGSDVSTPDHDGAEIQEPSNAWYTECQYISTFLA